jgi:hypothetical protein
LLVFRKYNEYEISYEDIEGGKDVLEKKFTQSRQISKDIGKSSWILMKNQTISLFLSIAFFMLVLIMK